jgi:hypothetical protein
MFEPRDRNNLCSSTLTLAVWPWVDITQRVEVEPSNSNNSNNSNRNGAVPLCIRDRQLNGSVELRSSIRDI